MTFLSRCHGQAAVDRVLTAAGETRTVGQLGDPIESSSYDEVLTLFSAAADQLNDPDIGAKVGREYFRQRHGEELREEVLAAGTPGTVYAELIPRIFSRRSVSREVNAVDVGRGHAFVASVTQAPVRCDRVLCDYTAGLLGEIPTVFGLDRAQVAEVECQARGDLRCLYELRWREESEAQLRLVPGSSDFALESMLEKIESLEAMAAELTSLEDIDAVLDTVAQRAGLAVGAERFLLAVLLPGDESYRTHAIGFSREEATVVGAEVIAQLPVQRGGANLMVDVESKRRRFGRVAAFYPEGHSSRPEDHRLLRAYAGFAASALETAAALAESRLRTEALSTMLRLSDELARAESPETIADVVARTSSTVVECDQVAVLLWHPDEHMLVRAAVYSSSESVLKVMSNAPTGIRDRHLAGRFLEMATPVEADIATADPSTSAVLALAGMMEATVVPIVSRQEFLGTLVVDSPGVIRGSTWRARRAESLWGIAGLTANAIYNLRLMDRIVHQAHHDALTGLPNAKYFMEQALVALSNAERQSWLLGILYLDLDIFKEVNDRFGHAAGDQALRAASARLMGVTRRGDTVARIGGDEFAILIPHAEHIEEVEVVAQKIVAALDRPVEVAEQSVRMGVSVGVTVFPHHGDAVETLIRRADEAMYRAKAEGRSRYTLYGAA